MKRSLVPVSAKLAVSTLLAALFVIVPTSFRLEASGHGRGHWHERGTPSEAKLQIAVDTLSSYYDFAEEQFDDTFKKRAGELSEDPDLPDETRCEFAALSEHGKRAYERSKKDVEEWASVESSIIEAFPDQDSPYIGLLGAAEANGTDDESVQLAAKLRDYPRVPDWVRDRAELILGRANLVGIKFSALAEGIDLAAPDTLDDRPIVFYTWTSEVPESVANLTEQLEAYSSRSPNAVFIGLRIRSGRAVTRKLAKELPGSQLDPNAPGIKLLASRLCANLPCLVYSFDDLGILREIDVAR